LPLISAISSYWSYDSTFTSRLYQNKISIFSNI
jgi:hypothetical protein